MALEVHNTNKSYKCSCTIIPTWKCASRGCACNHSGFSRKRPVPQIQYLWLSQHPDCTSPKVFYGQFVKIFMVKEGKIGMSCFYWVILYQMESLWKNDLREEAIIPSTQGQWEHHVSENILFLSFSNLRYQNFQHSPHLILVKSRLALANSPLGLGMVSVTVWGGSLYNDTDPSVSDWHQRGSEWWWDSGVSCHA